MKKEKISIFVLGLIAGIILSATDVVDAASKTVSALLAPQVKYTVDGVEKKLPEGVTTLNYQGSVYVPARFVAEALGGYVHWDQNTQTVTLKSPPPQYVYIQKESTEEKEESTPEKVKEEIKEEPKEEKQNEKEKDTSTKDLDDFKKIPITFENPYMKIEINSIFFDSNRTRIYLTLTNKTEKPMQLDQAKTIAEINGRTYKASDIAGVYRSDEWYQDLQPEEERTGYIALPKIDEEEIGMTLNLTIFENDMFQKTYTPSFDITWHEK